MIGSAYPSARLAPNLSVQPPEGIRINSAIRLNETRIPLSNLISAPANF